MKRVATPGEPIVAVPVAVIAVDVHLALVIPAVERSVAMYRIPSIPPSLENSFSIARD